MIVYEKSIKRVNLKLLLVALRSYNGHPTLNFIRPQKIKKNKSKQVTFKQKQRHTLGFRFLAIERQLRYVAGFNLFMSTEPTP